MNRRLVKSILVALLVAVVVFGYRSSGSRIGGPTPLGDQPTLAWAVLAFGIFNVLFSPAGTAYVRAAAIALTAWLLWTPIDAPLEMIALLLMWMVWPPAFMVAWALGQPRVTGPAPVRIDDDAPGRRARRTLAALIAALSVASLCYRALVHHSLDQTAALFVGLPALLAILVVVAAQPRSAIAVAAKATTVGLLVSVIFLWEGALCVVMSAPLFYTVAILVASSLDAIRQRKAGSTTLPSFLLIVAIAPMSLEGVTPLTTIDRSESVTASKVVHSPAAAVERALYEPPRFERGRPRPLFLRAGFPTPESSRIDYSGAAPRWIVRMRGGEMLLNGMEHRVGDLILDLEEARPGLMHWRAISDASHMTHFLRFRESIVEWTPLDAQTTRVTWTIRFDRGLDPAWYFGPMERYATRLAAGYLIDAVATP